MTVVTEAIRNPWVHVNELSSVLWIIFMVDASVRLWRRGGAENRRRARVVGGSIIFFLVFAAGLASLQDNQIVQIPYFVSLSFLPMILVVSYELGRNITQIAGLAENLRESEAALSLAAESAGAGLWAVNSEGKFLWLTERTRQLYGLSIPDLPDLEDLKAIWHPDDREYLHAALMSSLTDGQEFKEEHRVLDRDGTTRWISSRGRTYPGEGGEPNRLMGASIDITVRKRVEEEVLRHNGELAHMSRVSLAGELSGALVHELGQPLGAVLANSETAQLLLRSPEPDREELNSILVDIQDDSVRAGQIIHDMRTFLKQQVVAFDPIDLQQLFSEVEKLATPDATLRGSKLFFNVSPGLPPVLGHRVQLQQVVLNLILNGLQSMEDSASDERVLRVEADLLESGGLHIMVKDRGRGLPDSSLDEVFTPFLTTKPNGLGMGLAICRRIIHAHGGKIWIENNEHAGATSHIHLPVSAESQGFSS